MRSARWSLSRPLVARVGLSLLLVPAWLSACSTITQPTTSTHLTARPGMPTVAPVIGRSDLGLNNGRDGFLYVPESYDPAVAAPLLVLLHGAGGNTQTWVNYQARADANGMVLLAVDSRAQTWDMVLGYLGPDHEFIDLALAHAFARVNINPARIALVGFSDGASYALALGRANGDLFSHIIAYSPGYLAEIGPTIGTGPIFISHGTSDTVLPIDETRTIIVPYLHNYGHPVVFREFDGGHAVPAEISDAAMQWFLGGGALNRGAIMARSACAKASGSPRAPDTRWGSPP
jgi:phospholipase/carboxylesterase